MFINDQGKPVFIWNQETQRYVIALANLSHLSWPNQLKQQALSCLWPLKTESDLGYHINDLPKGLIFDVKHDFHEIESHRRYPLRSDKTFQPRHQQQTIYQDKESTSLNIIKLVYDLGITDLPTASLFCLDLEDIQFTLQQQQCPISYIEKQGQRWIIHNTMHEVRFEQIHLLISKIAEYLKKDHQRSVQGCTRYLSKKRDSLEHLIELCPWIIDLQYHHHDTSCSISSASSSM